MGNVLKAPININDIAVDMWAISVLGQPYYSTYMKTITMYMGDGATFIKDLPPIDANDPELAPYQKIIIGSPITNDKWKPIIKLKIRYNDSLIDLANTDPVIKSLIVLDDHDKIKDLLNDIFLRQLNYQDEFNVILTDENPDFEYRIEYIDSYVYHSLIDVSNDLEIFKIRVFKGEAATPFIVKASLNILKSLIDIANFKNL